MNNIGKLPEVANTTVSIGVLNHDTKKVLTKGLDLLQRIGSGEVDDLELDSKALGTACHDLQALGVDTVRNDVGLARSLLSGRRHAAHGHGHGLGSCGAFVEKTGIGDGEASQVANHGLVVKEGLETTLADFWLIGSVAGIPRRVLQHVSLDDWGGGNAVEAIAVEPRLLLVF